MTPPAPKPIPRCIVDTHALVWHLIADSKLSELAKAFLDDVDNGKALLVIPAVVLSELFMIVEKGRTTLTAVNFAAQLKTWQSASNVQLTSLTPQLVIDSATLTSIPDIFDRLIVAEARALNVPLITRDPIITNSKLANIIW